MRRVSRALRRRRHDRRARLWSDAAAIALAAFVVGGPALLTANGFMVDFTTHLWSVSVQEHAISANLGPTYFISADRVGVFYPEFLFYGGTLFAAAGALAAALGGRVDGAYVTFIVLGVCGAYGGLLWLARQLGVRSWWAHAPALTFTTSAIYVSTLYGFGDWPAFIAISSIPLLVASGWRLARASRVGLAPAVLFVASAALFAGSHSLTLLVGSSCGALALVLLALALGPRLAAVTVRRALAIAGLGVLAVALDAWFLLPTVLDASDTDVAHSGVVSWAYTAAFNTPAMMFNPLRAVPDQGLHALYVQAPVWFLAWALAALAMLWRRLPAHYQRALIGLGLLLAAGVLAILTPAIWNALPFSGIVQFPYRLDTWIALDVAGLVLVAVLALERFGGATARRRAAGALVVASAVSLALCVWQLWVPDTHGQFARNGMFPAASSYDDRDRALAGIHRVPHSMFALYAFDDIREPVIATQRTFWIDPSRVAANHASLIADPPPGAAPFATNIAGGPDAVTVSGGIVVVGRTADGFEVARRTRAALRGPVRIDIAPAGGPLAVGRIVSLSAIAVLLALLALATLHSWRAAVARRRTAQHSRYAAPPP